MDVIIFATGFHIDKSTNEPEDDTKSGEETENSSISSNSRAYQLDIIGENGFRAKDWSKQGPKAYLGVSYPSFPNMFFLLGPNTTLGHNSVIFMAECQVNYIISLMKGMMRRNLTYITVKDDVMVSYYSWVMSTMKDKVWNNCFSWYRAPVKSGSNSPGTSSVDRKGEILALWPATVRICIP